MIDIIIFFLIGVAVILAILGAIQYQRSIDSAVKKLEEPKKIVFDIRLCQGQYFVFQDGFCIKCCNTYEEAKNWLTLNRENYAKKDKILYIEEY